MNKTEKYYIATARYSPGGDGTIGLFSTERKATSAGKKHFKNNSMCYAIDIIGVIVNEVSSPTMVRRVCERR